MNMSSAQKNSRKIAVLAGPTAVGKTKYAIGLAKALDAEIISCDSMQLYKYMDIGSAKPSSEELSEVRHYLIGEIDPSAPFSVAEYQQRAKEAIETVFSRGRLPLVTGGTGLYLNSLLYDMDFAAVPGDRDRRRELEAFARSSGNAALYQRLCAADPAAAARLHPNNVKRVIRALEAAENDENVGDFSKIREKTGDYGVILMGLTRNREELYQRINMRVSLLFEHGLVEEVQSLMDRGLTADDISMKGIGYKEVIDYLNGAYDLATAADMIRKNTRHYAKRQMTWFSRYEDMKWFDLSLYMKEADALEDMILWVRKNR